MFVLKWACQDFTQPWHEAEQLSDSEFIILARLEPLHLAVGASSPLRSSPGLSKDPGGETLEPGEPQRSHLSPDPQQRCGGGTAPVN